MRELSKIEAVNVREVWAHEENDFTPWLAEHLPKLKAVLHPRLERIMGGASS